MPDKRDNRKAGANVEVRRTSASSRRPRPVRDPSEAGRRPQSQGQSRSSFPKGTPLHSERRASPQGTQRRGSPRPQSQRPQGQRPQGQRPQGQRPQGQRPQGQRPQGQRPQGQRPQGQRPQGQRPQGQRPQGQRPQGAGGSPRVRATGYPVRSGRAPSARRSEIGERAVSYAVTAKTTVAEFASELAERRRERIVAQNERREITERKRNIGIIRTRSGVDRPMLVLILMLLALGTIAVFSASYPYALAEGNDSMYYVRRQLSFAGIGIVVMFLASLLPPAFYKRFAVAIFAVTALLLAAVPVIGINYQGTKRWIGIPGTPFTAQPSEIMKFAIVLVLAWYLDKYRERVTDRLNLKRAFVWGVLFPGFFVGGACILIAIEKHLSAAIITAAIGLTVMLIGGSHVVMTAISAAAAGAGFIAFYLVRNPYALKRVNTKFDEDANKLAEKWQTTQGLYAIGNGGPFGVGLGSSIQKYSYVSEAHTDFIFTIWCEETGYVGALAVIILYILFIWRGFKIAMHAPDTFSALTVYGLTAHVGIQAFLNMLVVTDNMVNTGISLPFFSYGGSSLIFLMAEMGIILSISKHSFQKS